MVNIELTKHPNYYQIDVTGQLTGGTETDSLIEAIEVAQDDKKSLIINMENCIFISSIVIGLLLKKHVKFNELNIKLVITGLNQTLQQVFKMTKLNTILNIESDIDASINKVN